MSKLVALWMGLFIYSSVIVLFYKSGIRQDAIKKRLHWLSSSDKKGFVMDEELAKPIAERIIKPLIKEFSLKINKLAPQHNKSKNQRDEKLKKKLNQAGFGISAAEYRFYRLLFFGASMAFFTVIAFLLRLETRFIVLWALVGIYIGYAVARYHLALKITKRKKAMEQQLPDILDLLSVSVEAGLGFEQAIFYITNHFEGPMIDELTITYREMSMGITRREALTRLSERCDLEEIKSFVGALVQAGQLGISIKNVLRAQSNAMRQSRKNKIEEKAMKVSVKILIPMVVFIFPVIFIVLLGPAALSIIEVFG